MITNGNQKMIILMVPKIPKIKFIAKRKEKQVIDESDETKDAVKNKIGSRTNSTINVSKLFNRFYFSVITGCLLGMEIFTCYNVSKTCSLLQSLITLMLIYTKNYIKESTYILLNAK